MKVHGHCWVRFQSTLPARGSDAPCAPVFARPTVFQSTLPARGSDVQILNRFRLPRSFNPRSPRGGATLHISPVADGVHSFNPRSPRGGATHGSRGRIYPSAFQSTLPARGSDAIRGMGASSSSLFQSTLPARGSDRAGLTPPADCGVSIHAPREGERPGALDTPGGLRCFNPRSPRGGAT